MRSHGCIHDEDGAFSLFLEDLSAHDQCSWSDDDCLFAARAIGRYHGASAVRAGTGTGPGAIRTFSTVPEIARAIADARENNAAFRSPAVLRFLSVWDRSAAAFDLLARLPRVLSHGDCHCQNLFLSRDAGEVVAIDWAYPGPGGAGEDLGSLVTAEFVWGKMSFERFRALEPRAFDVYLAGLREMGHEDDARISRLGYVARIAIDAGLRMLLAASRHAEPEYSARFDALVPYLDEANELASELFGLRLD